MSSVTCFQTIKSDQIGLIQMPGPYGREGDALKQEDTHFKNRMYCM